MPALDFIQGFSLVGAFLQLIVYFLMQIGKISSETLKFQIPTTIGSGIMVFVAIHEQQSGFFLMEGCWFIASIIGLLRTIKVKHYK